MHRQAIRTSVMVVLILLLPFPYTVTQQTSSLLIEGPSGQARVIQMQGRNFVDIDELARITGGTLRFLGNEIVLKLPGGAMERPM
jgi:hypothetical protein